MEYKPPQQITPRVFQILNPILLNAVLPLTIFVLVAIGWSFPAFKSGFIFGTFDLALHAGIGKSLAPHVHNIVAGDQARQDGVWAALNYMAIHSGHLPLWNPYSDLGLPELANFQSAPFSLPSLISYMFPVNICYSVIVISKIILTAMGCYVLARVLKISFGLSLLAGIAAELAGPTAAWAGWPQTGVSEWFCWIIACLVLIIRKPKPIYGIYLALATAFLIAGGFPEVIAIAAIAVAIFICTFLIRTLFKHPQENAGQSENAHAKNATTADIGNNLSQKPRFSKKPFIHMSHDANILKPYLTICLSIVAGVLLSAPTWLPALKVLSLSVSSTRPIQPTLPIEAIFGFIDPTWFGLPTSSSVWFGPSNYYEMASFVGLLIFAGVLLALKRKWHDKIVMTVTITLVVLFCLAFHITPIYNIATEIPIIKTIAFGRSLLVICPLLVILAAIGLEDIKNKPLGLFDILIIFFTATLWIGLLVTTYANNVLTTAEKNLRLHGLYLSLIPFLALLLYVWTARKNRAVVKNKTLDNTKRRLAQLSIPIMVMLEALTMIGASYQINTWSSSYLPQNEAVSKLISYTKTSLVALGGNHAPMQAPRLGIFPELNAAYQIRELAGYDAVTPEALDKEWILASAAPNLAQYELAGDQTNFAPDITSISQAKMFGVSYVLEPVHAPLRLITDAATRLSEILSSSHLKGVVSKQPDIITGLLDDMEWRLQQPLLARQFPATKPRFIYDYLDALATGQSINPPLVDPIGIKVAQMIFPLIKSDILIQNNLDSLVTRRPPAGFKFVAILGSEKLYQIPGKSGASLAKNEGEILNSLTYAGDSTAQITIYMLHPGWVSLAVDDEPGWSAKINGKFIPTRSFQGLQGGFLQVKLPKGRSEVTISYWPEYLTLSLIIFLISLIAIMVTAAIILSKTIRIHAA